MSDVDWCRTHTLSCNVAMSSILVFITSARDALLCVYIHALFYQPFEIDKV
jgi:hypothetical protein